MNSLKKISQQTIWQLIGKVISAGSTFIILGIVARSYGESGTGIFTLALAYIAIFFQFADFGFNAHLLGKLHGDEENLQLEWRQLLGVRLVLSLILTLFAITLLPLWSFTTPELTTAIIFGSLAIVGSAVFLTTNLVFQGKLSYERSVISSSVGTLISLGLVAWFTYLKLPVAALVFAQSLGWIILALISLVLLRKFIKRIWPVFNLEYSLDLLKNSWPIALTLAFNVIYFRADAFMIAFFRNSAEVGIYNVAYQVFQTALVLPAFIMNSYYPLLLSALNKSTTLFSKQVKLAAFSLLILSIVSTVVTYLFAPTIITLLTGGGFNGSVESLQILSLGFPAYFVTALLIWVLVAKKEYKLMLLIYLIGGIFNLATNYFFIPQSSFIAASWITVVSEYLILTLQLVSLFWIL
ncbi:MAG: flippase [Candidatus Daviesbacteria bacterium]|nr:flippase [Candidatus Daviesbacteria bacterium]